ncbi:MAG: inactive transglutaminase family protein, partial [Gammaproteobacteria bacterium]
AKIEFEGQGRGALVKFDIPDELGGFLRLDEYFVARNYGLNIEQDGDDRRAEWSTRRAHGNQRLYYRTEMVPRAVEPAAATPKDRQPKPPAKPKYEEPLASAIQDVLGEVRAESANVFTFVSQLLVKLNATNPDSNAEIIRGKLERDSEAWVARLQYVLAGARITTRMVRGAMLEDRSANQHLVPWLEVHNGERWEGFDPRTGHKGYPENFVRWTVGDAPLLAIEGGNNASVVFAVSRYAQSLTSVARERAEVSHSWLANLLLFDLPVNTQNVYRILLMVPLGALIVAFMRTIVGIPTLGTFMPILVAIAFRETELAWGIGLFVVVTLAGLSLRFYLERLQLLLVPRLCSVLVLVVILMLAISLVSAKLGLDRGFSIALFPVVILTMVIEHMSVVWEESGPGAAFKEGLGSLAVAILGYLLMTNEYLTHVVFLFPEVLLLILALFILLGRYTGYRVTELLRFRDIVEAPSSDVRPDR